MARSESWRHDHDLHRLILNGAGLTQPLNFKENLMGGGSPPKAPPPPAPPPTETSADVQQEAMAEKKKAGTRAGKQSTFLTEQVSTSGGATVLG